MSTDFIKLNTGWNAEPNAPAPRVLVVGGGVVLEVLLNPFEFPRCVEGDRARIVFKDCRRYRLGPTNDEGWHSGQCRFSSLAPAWGEFYEVKGDPLLDQAPEDWHEVDATVGATRHFLFYLRDETFECEAVTWSIDLPGETVLYRPVGQAELDIIAKTGNRRFPTRLPEQPIFYPVCNHEYAVEITTKWNAKEQGVWYVTKFSVKSGFLSQYERKVVGASRHEEYWVPAEELDAFNDAIIGQIEVVGEYRNDEE